MKLELLIRTLLAQIVKNHNYRSFALYIRYKYPWILAYLDKWNPDLVKYSCTITVKVYQFLQCDKEFPLCANPACNNLITKMGSYKSGYALCCSNSCRYAYLKTFTGEKNPNFGNRWSKEQKKVQSAKIKNAYIRDPTLRQRVAKNKGRRMPGTSAGLKKFHLEHPGIYKGNHRWSEEDKIRIGKQSRAKFTDEYKALFRKRQEEHGIWIPLSKKKDIEIYYRLANWIEKMFDKIEDPAQLKLLKELRVYSSYTNTKGVVRDHIYSRRSGFENLVFPEILRHPCNCQLLSSSDNSRKRKGAKQYGDGDMQTLDELFQKIEQYRKPWKEQALCIELIQKYRNGERWRNPYA